MTNDLISRSALLEKEWLTMDVDGYPIRVVEVGDILDAPTIEAEPVKHAKWEKAIRTDSDGYDTYWFRCSECHEDAPKNSYGHDYFSKRCPRCGSYMTIESEATDE